MERKELRGTVGKKLFIAEKPSVAAEFAKALGMNARRQDGYMESEGLIVTWCVGHLVTMSYPEVYDPALKKWSMQTLPFLPETFRYEIIPSAKKQFAIVSSLLKRKDVEVIYVCTDSGREGEYIYRLVDMMAEVGAREKRRVWIDSQTEEEIRRGIREAKPESAYDNLAASAFLRAKEDYLMGINFSRVLTLKYGNLLAQATGQNYAVISAGRVMTCVLGMTVRREREIRSFVKTPFYRVLADCKSGGAAFQAEWRAAEGSRYFASPLLYKENGFLKRADAEELIASLPQEGEIESLSRKKETKKPPLLFNLAELQNECARLYKISPDQTLSVAQELYEKKLTTYPRTDARVLSSAVAKEIHKNLSGLRGVPAVSAYAEEILSSNAYMQIGRTKYVNDKAITDHYAIIPTGQGLSALRSLSPLSAGIYERICRRFLSIFYPAAEYSRLMITVAASGNGPTKETPGKRATSEKGRADVRTERFYASFRAISKEGYLKVAGAPREEREAAKAKAEDRPKPMREDGKDGRDAGPESSDTEISSEEAKRMLETLGKGERIAFLGFAVREGETSPPKRYTSGSMILAMENAGQLIEDEELRAQIRGSGIGTSATRAEILKKLVAIRYLSLNEKTQVLTPTMFGEMVNDVVYASVRSLLNPELTASWEKGLTYVSEGTVTEAEYMQKLNAFVRSRTEAVKQAQNEAEMRRWLMRIPQYYSAQENRAGSGGKTSGSRRPGKSAAAAETRETKQPAAAKSRGTIAGKRTAAGRKRRTES